MKKFAVSLMVFAAVAVVSPAFAQTGSGFLGQAPSGGSEPAMAVSIDPFSFLWALPGLGLSGSFEMRLTKTISLYIPVAFVTYGGTYYYNWSYFSVGAEAHYYLTDTSFNFGQSDALRGLWAGAGINLNFASGFYSDFGVGIALKAGYKYVLGGKAKGLFIEPYIGYNYHIGASYYPYSGSGINIGFAF